MSLGHCLSPAEDESMAIVSCYSLHRLAPTSLLTVHVDKFVAGTITFVVKVEGRNQEKVESLDRGKEWPRLALRGRDGSIYRFLRPALPVMSRDLILGKCLFCSLFSCRPMFIFELFFFLSFNVGAYRSFTASSFACLYQVTLASRKPLLAFASFCNVDYQCLLNMRR